MMTKDKWIGTKEYWQERLEDDGGPSPIACVHDWAIWPETDGTEQRCRICKEFRRTPPEDMFWKKGPVVTEGNTPALQAGEAGAVPAGSTISIKIDPLFKLDRNLRIVLLRLRGCSFHRIAEITGLSAPRCSQICWWWIRQLEKHQ